MTVERVIAIASPVDDKRRQLIADIRSAAGRAERAEPGDRLDAIRHEALCSQLETWAFAQRGRPGVTVFDLDSGLRPDPVLIDTTPLPDWVPPSARPEVTGTVDDGGVLIAIVLPLEPGERTTKSDPKPAPPAAKPWKAGTEKRRGKNGKPIEVEIVGRRAVEVRFRDQLAAALRDRHPKPIYPTGISNRVLSDVLRDHVNQPRGAAQVDVPVEYRDGSRSQHSFPLRSLALVDTLEEPHDLSLKMALLSIRHTEMDDIVDGAWLRNAQISQPRPHAETDDLVYGISCEQFRALTDSGRRRLKLELFQTGFEPANVGFYRAVVTHLLTYPGSLTVVPQYHQEPRVIPTRRKKPRRQAEASQSEYIPGKAWTTKREVPR